MWTVLDWCTRTFKLEAMPEPVIEGPRKFFVSVKCFSLSELENKHVNYVWDLRFSQWCCWRFMSSGIWHCCWASNSCCFEASLTTSWNTCETIQCCVPADLHLHVRYIFNFHGEVKSWWNTLVATVIKFVTFGSCNHVYKFCMKIKK
jgi:hypothetical protein